MLGRLANGGRASGPSSCAGSGYLEVRDRQSCDSAWPRPKVAAGSVGTDDRLRPVGLWAVRQLPHKPGNLMPGNRWAATPIGVARIRFRFLGGVEVGGEFFVGGSRGERLGAVWS